MSTNTRRHSSSKRRPWCVQTPRIVCEENDAPPNWSASSSRVSWNRSELTGRPSLCVSGKSISKHLFGLIPAESVELLEADPELREELESRFRNHVNIARI